MIPLLTILHILELAAITVNKIAVPSLIRHEHDDRARDHVGGLVVALAERGDDGRGDDAGLRPGGCDGVDADWEIGGQLGMERAQEAEDAVFRGCCGVLVDIDLEMTMTMYCNLSLGNEQSLTLKLS